MPQKDSPSLAPACVGPNIARKKWKKCKYRLGKQNVQHPAADTVITECLSTSLEALVYGQRTVQGLDISLKGRAG